MKTNRMVVSLAALFIWTSVQASTDVAAGQDSKIPVTTSSGEAREYFLQGRDLSERVRNQESREFFEKAVAADPDFALAHLYLCQVQPNARAFFESLEAARAAVDKVSEGERLMIAGLEAGYLEADPAKQQTLYQQLVDAYPGDERAHSLLALCYMAQQKYDDAIKTYQSVIRINPEFSQAYNQMGYCYRFLEKYYDAEKAFVKYIKLIPDDPNPYDSYAELLMKVGRFDESIDIYRRAMKINPDFTASHLGIAFNLCFKGDHESARRQLQNFYDSAKDDGQRRTVIAAMAITFIDEGLFEEALGKLSERYEIARAIDDTSAMSNDFNLIGLILLEAGRPEEALIEFTRAIRLTEASSVEQSVKIQSQLTFLYYSVRVNLARGELDQAATKAASYAARAESIDNPYQEKIGHQLAGMIALENGDYDTADRELALASQVSPYNIYLMARAAEGRGDIDRAREIYRQAANFNITNSLSYALIRAKAARKGETM
ncbi:MAG: tetratricopeptide repeat protein [bacterium]